MTMKATAYITAAMHPVRGCSVAPRCLACPLPMCIDDVAPDTRNREQFARVLVLRLQGKSAGTIAAETGMEMRAVYRALEKVRA